ncbi:MAG: hypothetical protein ACKV22_34310 [Bryobacteraceae bacterium]
MQRRSALAGIIAILAPAGLGYTAWRFVKDRSDQSCGACSRPVHSHMKTVAMVDGKRGVYCCLACALTEQKQSGRRVQVVETTNFLSNRPLIPENSYLVRNSDVNPCRQHHPAVGENNQPLEACFDRCAPSVLAFPDQKAAGAFAGRHGGQVLRFPDFASAFQR